MCALDFIVESAPCSPRCGFLSSLPYTLLYWRCGFAIGLAKQHFVPLVVSPKKRRHMVITGPLEGAMGGSPGGHAERREFSGLLPSCPDVTLLFQESHGAEPPAPLSPSPPHFPSARRKLLSGFLSGAMFCTTAQTVHCLYPQLPLATAPRP